MIKAFQNIVQSSESYLWKQFQKWERERDHQTLKTKKPPSGTGLDIKRPNLHRRLLYNDFISFDYLTCFYLYETWIVH